MQRRNPGFRAFTIRLVVSLAALLAVACSRPPDEERIRDAIQAMQAAAEAHDATGVLQFIAEDFIGNNGDVDRDGLLQFLKLQLLRAGAFAADARGIAIEVDEDRASAKFDLVVSDRSRRWLPSGSETYKVLTGWRREGSRWICYSATWTDSSH